MMQKTSWDRTNWKCFSFDHRKLGPVNDPLPGQSVWGDENSDQGRGILQGQHQWGKQSSPGVLLHVVWLSGQQRRNHRGRHSLLYQVRFINPVSKWYICILKEGGVFHNFCWPFGKEKMKMIGHILKKNFDYEKIGYFDINWFICILCQSGMITILVQYYFII